MACRTSFVEAGRGALGALGSPAFVKVDVLWRTWPRAAGPPAILPVVDSTYLKSARVDGLESPSGGERWFCPFAHFAANWNSGAGRSWGRFRPHPV